MGLSFSSQVLSGLRAPPRPELFVFEGPGLDRLDPGQWAERRANGEWFVHSPDLCLRRWPSGQRVLWD
jgi:hypothetical protein